MTVKPKADTARDETDADAHGVKPGTAPHGHPDHVEDRRDAHTERNLDDGLEETFPASDPVSISPGAD
jgi:hypothetical protein